MSINVSGNVLSTSGFTSSGEIINYPDIVTDGLILWLDAGHNASYINSSNYYDCGYGCQYYASSPGCTNCNTQIKDMSGFGNDGTFQAGTVVTYTGATGGAMFFDGVDNYVQFPIPSTATSSVTIQVWVNVVLGRKGCFMKIGSGCNGYAIGIGNGNQSTAGNNIIGIFPCIRWIDTATSYGSNGWKLVTMIIDASGVPSIYLNDTLIGSYTGTTMAAPTTYGYLGRSVGDEASASDRAYTGDISTAFMYNKILSLAEIRQNYNAGRRRYGV